MKFIFNLFLLATFSSVSFGFEVSPNVPFHGLTSGHEEITRQAVNILKTIEDENIRVFFTNNADLLEQNLEPIPLGLDGFRAANPIILGNFASDFPDETSVFSLTNFWNVKEFSFSESPDAQTFHFLRNYLDDITLDSARQTCLKARDHIKKATTGAVEYWKQGNKIAAFFLMGAATHTIQDSFSGAHAIRAGNEANFNPLNICYYGARIHPNIEFLDEVAKKVCYHLFLDDKDVIWNFTDEEKQDTEKNFPDEKAITCDKYSAYPKTEGEKQACLRSEARLAKLATLRYLYLAIQGLKIPTLNFADQLDQKLFDGPSGLAKFDRTMPDGIMRCDNLSDEVVQGVDASRFHGGDLR